MKTKKQKQLTQQQLGGRRASQRKYYKKVTGVCIKFRADRPGKDQDIYALMQLMGPKKAINEMYGAYMEKLMREGEESSMTHGELYDELDALRFENAHLRDYTRKLKEDNQELANNCDKLFNALINANREGQKYATD